MGGGGGNTPKEGVGGSAAWEMSAFTSHACRVTVSVCPDSSGFPDDGQAVPDPITWVFPPPSADGQEPPLQGPLARTGLGAPAEPAAKSREPCLRDQGPWQRGGFPWPPWVQAAFLEEVRPSRALKNTWHLEGQAMVG